MIQATTTSEQSDQGKGDALSWKFREKLRNRLASVSIIY
jgi:hypothetical protein